MPQNAELSSSRVIGEMNLLERNERVRVEAGRKRRVSLRERLDQAQGGVKQSSLNSRRKPGRVKVMQLKFLAQQTPAHMVHPQRCVSRLNIRFSSPWHMLFPAWPCPLTGIAVAVRSKE